MLLHSVPELFALAHGVRCAGANRCFYCSAPCSNKNPTAQHVKDSFTGRNDVACPGSLWVCAGCLLCLNESATITMLDGVQRTGQKVRCYSWEATECRARAGTKAHLHHWRALCLTPPVPPFALVLSDSGQRQLLYRGVVCRSREHVILTLEGERIAYRPDSLRERLDLCGQIAAASGKPALAESVTARLALAVMERYPAHGEELLLRWEAVREEPISHLAAWLCAGRDECQSLYPAAEPAGAQL